MKLEPTVFTLEMCGIPSRKPTLHTARTISSFLLKTFKAFLPKPSMMKVTATSTIANCTDTHMYIHTNNSPKCSHVNVQIAQNHTYSSVPKPGELGTFWSPFHSKEWDLLIYYPASSKHKGIDFATALKFLILLARCWHWHSCVFSVCEETAFHSFPQLKEKIRILCDLSPVNWVLAEQT